MAFKRISPLTLDGLSKYFSFGYHRLIEHAVYTFGELNVADRLVNAKSDQGMTVQEIIGDNSLNWNSDMLYRILRSCADAGIVEKVNDDKHFVLTQSGRMLTSGHPSHARDFLLYALGPLVTSAANQLPDIVRNQGTGSGIARVTNGLNLYQFLSQPNQKHLSDIFSGAMAAVSISSGKSLVENVDFDRFTTLIDIGGGSGAYLAQILEHYPSIEHGIVLDLPHVINQTTNSEEFKSRMIPDDKYKFVIGNMFDSSTIPSADAYILKNILHNYDDEKVVAILSSIREASLSRIERHPVNVFIAEFIILPDGALSNWQSHALDIVMGFLCEGARERTQEEFEKLLEKAGFKLKKVYPIQAPESIIEAVLMN
ncbi:unnamed protein product [Rotaria sp. Silwood1]|nr:unnamed protein product [Rotaria sp. Silwood1]CAF3769894.1 unnamed protein product [Rotaria sp. Silwood1]CAF3841267.1 unnamed protein product [Rotaria sp. Silwood1]CAF4736739.1 unnamed protein product [Rotaria sp. Silwood1]CAF4960038.1 unnamed protein product [Rotaria sp. Silwood1]